MKTPSPRWARRLLSALLPEDDREFVIGDIEERFHESIATRLSSGAARRWYWRQAVASTGCCWAARMARALRRPGPGATEGWWSSWLMDLRFSLRVLTRRPRFTLLALSTLTLGLGANVGIFSVVNGILMRPLAFPAADELVVLWTVDPTTGETYNVSGPNGLDVGRLSALESLYLYSGGEVVLASEDGTRKSIPSVEVTREVFDVLGLPLLVGPGFSAIEASADTSEVVIAHTFWQSRFGGRADILTRSLNLDGVEHRIVGVAPPGFRLPMAPDELVWRLFERDLAAQPRDIVWLGAVGRLANGVSLEQAQEQVAALWSGLRERYPAQTVDAELTLIELQRDLTATVRPSLLVLMGATAFLLLMACANVANLMLTRTAERRSELAVRFALGAESERILRQVLTETTLLSLIAAGLGVALAAGIRSFLVALAPPGIPRLDEVRFDPSVLAFAVGLALITTLLSGLIPSLVAAGRSLRSVLAHDGRIAGDGRGHGARRGLIVCQVAVATMLMVGAGLLIRSFMEVIATDPGYDIDRVLQASVLLPPDLYGEPERRAAFYTRLERRAVALPGVVRAGATMAPPLSETHVNFTLRVEGRGQPPAGQDPAADLGIASKGYFETLQIPLVKGRHFRSADRRDSPRVVIVSRLLVETLWPDGSDPIGQRISLLTGDWHDEPLWREIVGVVEDVRQQTLESEMRPYVYLPISQAPQFAATLLVRSSGPPEQLAGPVRELLAELEPALPVPEIATMELRLRDSLATRSFYALLLSFFAALALALAVVGIYGVLAFMVNQRTGEIGVRMTFGARRGQIMGLIVGEGMRVVGVGLAVGLLGAAALSRLLASLVYEIGVTDPLTYTGIAAAFTLFAFLACAVPAWRASSIDPVEALRR